jgi:hypothetical protein
MPNFKILCPVHADEEEITLPESYRGIGYSSAIHVFEGDIACNPNDKSKEAAILRIKVHLGNNSVWVEELSLPAGSQASDRGGEPRISQP